MSIEVKIGDYYLVMADPDKSSSFERQSKYIIVYQGLSITIYSTTYLKLGRCISPGIKISTEHHHYKYNHETNQLPYLNPTASRHVALPFFTVINISSHRNLWFPLERDTARIITKVETPAIPHFAQRTMYS